MYMYMYSYTGEALASTLDDAIGAALEVEWSGTSAAAWDSTGGRTGQRTRLGAGRGV
jgi:hypothetical protein